MLLETLDLSIAGRMTLLQPVGQETLEILVDCPVGPPKGLVLLAHPQPLRGGSARHKLLHYLAKALVEAGWVALRPNFRGVGSSTGQHDEGRSEIEDFLLLSRALQASYPDLPLVLFGFSFGAFVQAGVASQLHAAGQPALRVILAGLPVGRVPVGRDYKTAPLLPDTLLLHGEKDQEALLQSVLRHAEPLRLPVVVLPGSDHYFTDCLPELIRQVLHGLPLQP